MMQHAQAVRVGVQTAAGEALQLHARLQPAERGAAVVAPPHPLYGGSLDNPVVVRIVEGLRKAGVASLAFNWRGVEGSQGRATDDLTAAVGDFAATFTQLASSVPTGPYFAAGYSFGAGTALLHAGDEARVTGLVLIAPPVGMLRTEDLVAFRGPILIVIGDDDEYAPLAELNDVIACRPDIQLEVIAGADHFFHYGGLSDIDKHVTQHVAAWLR